MNSDGTNKKWRIYLSVLYVLFLIQWFWSVRHEYPWAVCRFNLEKSSNVIDIWAQLTPISKFLTVFVIYIIFHAMAVGVMKLVALKREKD